MGKWELKVEQITKVSWVKAKKKKNHILAVC